MMSLGQDFEFLLTTPVFDADVEFLDRLGFLPLGEADDGCMRLGDGAVRIAVQAGDAHNMTLVFRCADLAACRRRLEANGLHVEVTQAPQVIGGDEVLIVADPDSQRVMLASAAHAVGQRAGQSPGRLCGKFGELSLETADVQQTEPFWQKLSFRPTQYAPNPVTAWTSLSDDLLMVGLYNKGHVPHVFASPAITYFDEGMVGNLPVLRAKGLDFVQTLESGPDPQNAIAQAPGGQMFFLFSC